MDFSEAYNDTCSSVGLAARYGNLKLLKRLLEEGKDYCIKDNRGWFPIHEAACNGHTDCVIALMKAAQNNEDDPLEIWPSPFDIKDRNALVLAARNGHTETVKVLLELYTKNTVDSIAAFAASVAHPSVLSIFLEKIPSVINRRDEEGLTFLHLAVLKGSLKSIQLLLSARIDKEAKDEFGRSALHIVCCEQPHGYFDIIKLLVQNGCDVNSCDDLGFSVLFVAAQSTSDVNIIKYLVEHSADQYIGGKCLNFQCCSCDMNYIVPMNIAAERGHINILNFLINITDKSRFLHDCYVSPIISAVAGLQSDCLKTLLDNGYDINGQPIHCSDKICKGQHVFAIKALWDMHIRFESHIFQTQPTKLLEVLTILLKDGVDLQPISTRFTILNTVLKNNDNSSVLQTFVKYGVFEFTFYNGPCKSTSDHDSEKTSTFFEFLMLCLKRLLTNYEQVHVTNLKSIISFFPVIKFKSEDIVHPIPAITNVVPSLMQFCRHIIRTIIVVKDHNLINVPKLPLPNLLITYLMFGNEFLNLR